MENPESCYFQILVFYCLETIYSILLLLVTQFLVYIRLQDDDSLQSIAISALALVVWCLLVVGYQ